MGRTSTSFRNLEDISKSLHANPADSSEPTYREVFKNTGVILLGDAALVLGLFYTALWIRTTLALPIFNGVLTQGATAFFYPWPIVLSAHITAFFFLDLYSDPARPEASSVLRKTLAGTLIHVAFITMAYFFVEHLTYPRSALLVYGALHAVGVTAWRQLLHVLTRSIKMRVLIIGTNGMTRQVLEQLEMNPRVGKNVIGILSERDTDDDFVETEKGRYPILGTRTDAADLAQALAIDEIIITPEKTWQDELVDDLSRLGRQAPQLSAIPSTYEILIGRVKHVNINDIPMINVSCPINDRVNRFAKRAVDFLGGVVLGIFTLPIMLPVALAIRFSSKGPALFTQERMGREGQIFKLVKFRTMIQNAEELTGPTLAEENDPRVTSLGRLLRKTRIDELPQIWNVLRGEMSLVGPRPERPELVEAIEQEVTGYHERFKVKPGITGLAQTSGHYHTTAENKLRYDLAYIQNYSLFLDLVILLKTVQVVLTRKGS
jgi:exopolysaccharide biosynthesis polyprenyl glycosylphosphotransferase